MKAHHSKIVGEGLTYDDVLLIPAFSEVLPREVNIQTKFTKNITLNVPIVSAAMDTVTESAMAIAMAQEGGIGVLHKNMTIEQQAIEVRKVKRAESGMIIDPVTLPITTKVIDAQNCMKEYSIGGIPIVDDNGKLLGIVTNRDLRFEKNFERPISEVMTSQNIVTAGEGTSLAEAEGILQEHKIEKLPVVDANYKLVGLITFRDIAKLTQKPMANKDKYGRLRVAAAIGVTQDAVNRAEALSNAGIDAVIIDKDDPVVSKGIPFDGVGIEHIVVEKRIYEELIIFRSEDSRYSGIEWNLLEQRLTSYEDRTYDVLSFEITAIPDGDWEALKAEWESNNGFQASESELKAHEKKRNEKTIRYTTEYWFDITSFYGTN